MLQINLIDYTNTIYVGLYLEIETRKMVCLVLHN